MDCLPILGMISGCATSDLAMLRWIAYIKSLKPEIRHIFGKDNAIADMLSRVRFDDKDGMVSEDEEVDVDFFEAAYVTTRKRNTPTLNEFDESKYDESKYDGESKYAGCGVDKGRDQPNSEESVPILPTSKPYLKNRSGIPL